MFVGDFEELAKTNDNFRKVLHTCQYSQVVAMSLQPGEDIGSEVHKDVDQLFIIADGQAEAIVGNERQALREDDLVVVPAGTPHDIINTGYEELKLITIYSPPNHPDGTIHRTKADAHSGQTSAPSL